MSFLDDMAKKAKSALFVDEAPAPGQPAQQQTTAPANQQAPTVTSYNQPPVQQYQQSGSFVPSAVIDPKFIAHFDSVMESNNLPGNDYYELRKGLNAMAGMPIAENAKYLSAFMMLAVTPDHIKQTSQHYIQKIAEDANSFAEQTQQRRADKLQGRVAEMQGLEQQNQERQRQIAQLQAEMTATQEQIAQINTKMIEDSTKIEATERNYKHTMETVIKSIQDDVHAIDVHVVPVVAAQQPK